MWQPNYPNARAPAEIAERLRAAVQTSAHEFWPDEISLLDESLFDWQHLFNPRQLTDAYLLALAVQHNGAFVTFDHAVPRQAVSSAGAAHLLLI